MGYSHTGRQMSNETQQIRRVQRPKNAFVGFSCVRRRLSQFVEQPNVLRWLCIADFQVM